MSSPEKEEFRIFLPSMMRKNGGKFGDTLGNALVNKFTAPPSIRKSSQPEVVQSERSSDLAELNSKDAPTESVVDSANDFKGNNTLDHVTRQEILKDVRSNRVKSPGTRPKSNMFRFSTEITLEDNPSQSEITQSKDVPKTITSSVQPSQPASSDDKFEVNRRRVSIKNRSDRPVTIGNTDALKDNSLRSNGPDEVDSKCIGKKLGNQDKTLSNLSKSTEFLSTSPNSISSTVPIISRPNHDKSLRAMKMLAVKLNASISSMEKELTVMKDQLSNLITIIGEFDETDKK